MNYSTLMDSMQETGIGLAGCAGAWWSPTVAPFEMSNGEEQQLAEIGRSIFQFTDAVADELRENPNGAFAQQLYRKVPPHIAEVFDLSPMLMCRPDFQLVPTPNGIQLVLTEIEIAPSSQSYAHAMQVAYGLPLDIAPAFAKLLGGRDLLFVGTHEWSWYLKDQLAFCKALAAHGARGRVIYDRSFAQMQTEIDAGERWQRPIPGLPDTMDHWQPSITAHAERYGLTDFLLERWPSEIGDAIVFRFGYVEHFSAEQHAQFKRWQAQGATFLNPFSFHLDSKVTLTGVYAPAIRARLAAETVATLERCIPETILLAHNTIDDLVHDKDSWLIKFAGFDQSNAAWGGRSVRFGRGYSDLDRLVRGVDRWRAELEVAAQLDWPVVGQRLASTQQVTLDHFLPDGSITTLNNGYSRLRTFFLRSNVTDTANTVHCGSHLTVTGKTMNVSEHADGVVQAPVVFR